ncbi:hypothetical protein [Spiroplasma tabanidicola]|uniref:Lipoprotein n=1 Tax=Spiroplasma tabanidicola TaxID=324079 RepID=A0A6I6CAN4_9MOLU|nr:hypothetical protein [Spiroplasma tabanidicola]QGS51975.1 hypothetical protein STABA_v1c06120 [Spiroplasma tabanidicola]
MKKLLIHLISIFIITSSSVQATSCYNGNENKTEETKPEENHEVSKFSSFIDFMKAQMKNENGRIDNWYHLFWKDYSGISEEKQYDEFFSNTVNGQFNSIRYVNTSYVRNFGERIKNQLLNNEEINKDFIDKNNNQFSKNMYYKLSENPYKVGTIFDDLFMSLHHSYDKNDQPVLNDKSIVYAMLDNKSFQNYKEFKYIEIRVYKSWYLWDLKPEKVYDYEYFYIKAEESSKDLYNGNYNNIFYELEDLNNNTLKKN